MKKTVLLRRVRLFICGLLIAELVSCGGGRPSGKSPAYPISAQLNDTGIVFCSNENQVQQSCPQPSLPGQDAEFGRDAKANRLKKQGGGVAGFDWTKLDAQGKPLANQNQAWLDAGNESVGSRWSCVQDNVTGLVWEIKETDPDHPRYFGHTYSWWMASEQLNGGFPWHTSPGSCTGVTPCETQSYVDWVNQQGLCGHNDWRLPSVRELVSIAVLSSEIPAFDKRYFADTTKPRFFTGQTYAAEPSRVWYVYFSDGSVSSTGKSDASFLRLVRGGL
ncbi:MAG: hypothetical protein RL497_880 [Pseudomonadota bacterium]|jgi:hypothetical protein